MSAIHLVVILTVFMARTPDIAVVPGHASCEELFKAKPAFSALQTIAQTLFCLSHDRDRLRNVLENIRNRNSACCTVVMVRSS